MSGGDTWVLLVMPRGAHHAAYASALADAGYRVRSAETGEGGFAALLDLDACGCIVVDTAIADLTVAAFLDRARSYLRFHGVPCVVVGDAQEEHLGLRAQLRRNASPAALVVAVSGALRTGAAPPRAATATREVAE